MGKQPVVSITDIFWFLSKLLPLIEMVLILENSNLLSILIDLTYSIKSERTYLLSLDSKSLTCMHLSLNIM